MERIIVTGSFYSGKGETLQAIKKQFPISDGNHYLPKFPAKIRADERRKAARLKRQSYEYIPKLPDTDYSSYRRLVVAAAIGYEKQIPKDQLKRCFQEETLAEQPLYDVLHGMPTDDLDYLNRKMRAAQFSLAFFCEMDYEQVAPQNFGTAIYLNNALPTVYKDLGLNVVHLPVGTMESRLDIIGHSLAQLAA